jgi:hypothetical protein
LRTSGPRTCADHPIARISEVARLRIAQTQRTLAELRKQRPGVPIYLWGHSEGGFIVQAVEADVAGIIVTGEECGVDGARVAAPYKVPILYLLGENDPYVNGLGTPVSRTAESICASVFLGSTHRPVALAGNAAQAKTSWKKQRRWGRYRRAKPIKLAASNGRSFYAVEHVEALEDAKQMVVFACDKALAPRTNVFITGRHICTLVDVDGKPEP